MERKRIAVSDHAYEAYNRKVRPGLTLKQATRELRRLVDEATDRVVEKVIWHGEFPAYIEVSDGVALGLREHPDRYVAVTCVIRGGLSKGDRKKRRQRRIDRRTRRRMEGKRRKEGKRPDPGWETGVGS